MNVKVMRIDDRLIHGQIVTSWIAEAEAKTIVVADDKATTDEMQKMLLRMATPSGIELQILTIDDAATLLTSDTSNTNTLLIVRGPGEANELLEKGFKIDSINVGNISMKKGKKKVLPYLWLNDEEVDSLKKIADKNVKLDVRAVPIDRSQNAIELINKKY